MNHGSLFFTFYLCAVTRLVMSSSFLLSPFQPLPQLSLPQLFYTLSSIAAIIILSLAYSRLSGLFGSDKNMSITVKWGRERSVSSPSPNTALPRVYRASPSPSPHKSHSPFRIITTPLISAHAASRFPFLHLIPRSPYSAKLYRNILIFPLILSNSSMLVPS
jgi:hypothetical protein